ncbi:MAG: hypothetical protein IJ563_12405 [Selenomonadaceae bacterium]|nr:hypothetical protein [Selenomonadaceae bacterium]
MLRLNIRHALPQTDIRIQHSRVDDSHMIPAQIHTNNRQARSNKTVTQVRMDIDSYPSRHSYGAKNNTDLTREFGQSGIADVQASTSRHAQNMWSFIDNAAKRGNYIQQQYKGKLFEEANKSGGIEARAIPDPRVTVSQPSQVVGESDLGDVTAEISTTPFASIQITTGSAETYLKDQGFIRRWVSQDKYDIYA